MITTEKLLFDKEETEQEIKELHKTADRLEVLRDETRGTAQQQIDLTIQRLEKDIEWNEQILNEITDSIEFVRD